MKKSETRGLVRGHSVLKRGNNPLGKGKSVFGRLKLDVASLLGVENKQLIETFQEDKEKVIRPRALDINDYPSVVQAWTRPQVDEKLTPLSRLLVLIKPEHRRVLLDELTEVRLRPGMPGYEEAKRRFERRVNEQD